MTLLDVLANKADCAWPSQHAEAPWRALCDDARSHGLSGILRWEVKAQGAPLPPGISAILDQNAFQEGAAVLCVATLLIRTLDALALRNICPVILKGVGLSHRYYPDMSLRATTDVDLLVDPSDLSQAAQTLQDCGLSPPSDATLREADHEWKFTGQGTVELHFRALVCFGTRMDAAPLLARSRPAEFEGRRVRYLSPEDELVYLSAHAAAHAFGRVVWLYDLKRIIAALPDLNWAAVAERARDFGVSSAVYVALRVARDVLDAPVPEGALARFTPTSSARAVTLMLRRKQLLLASTVGQRPKLNFLVQALLGDSFRAGASFFGHHMRHSLERRLYKSQIAAARSSEH